MSGAPPGGGSLLRSILATVILLPLGIVMIALAVANRQPITISLDPFSAGQQASLATPPLPLFVVLFVVLIIGVMIGGFASWLRHGGGRRAARRLQRELSQLRAELEAHKRRSAADRLPPSHLASSHVPSGQVPPGHVPLGTQPPERLRLKAPLR